MQRAIVLGRRGMRAGDGGPFGAVVVHRGAIVGEGWNRVVATGDPTAHGEIVAIRAACRRLATFRLSGCELYTTGEPCPMCLSAIYWAHVDRVFFGFTVADAARIGFDDRVIYRELARPAGRRRIPAVQLLATEARALARAYAANPRRARY
jgi:guanine deaminase